MNMNKINRTEAAQKIREYVLRSSIDKNIELDDNIYDLGLVHSLFLMYLLIYIEKEFGIEIDDNDVDLSELVTISKIVDMLMEQAKNNS